MKVNKQSKIKVKNSGYKRSKFNWSHDVNTTFTWGEIQPTQCKLLVPGSKTTVETQNLIRLAPMVAPTFGRVKYKTFNQFVGISEVFPNFDAMMAQEPVTTSNGTKVPQRIPWIQLGKLSSYVLMGARATLYWVDPTGSDTQRASDAASGFYKTVYRKIGSSLPTEAATMLGLVAGTGGTMIIRQQSGQLYNCAPSTGVSASDVRLTFRPRLVKDSSIKPVYNSDGSNAQGIVLACTNINDLIPLSRETAVGNITALPGYQREITMDSADYVIEFTVEDSNNKDQYFALALECSDFGKRVRKIIQGCGYQIDFASTQTVSILPLLAQYKAYFDIFGLQLYKGWETTFAAKMIQIIEQNFLETVEAYGAGSIFTPLPSTNAGSLSDNAKTFTEFMFSELGNEFYTEDADFIGANIATLSVSPHIDTNKFITVDSNGAGSAKITEPTNTTGELVEESQTYSTTGGTVLNNTQYSNGAQGFINQIQHGQVDAELLKRMYRWVNRNTILGREIAKILRAQGLGKYVDECKSNFIGSTDTLITISDVISQAATDNAVLGEYGGRGLQYDATGTLVFENDEYGYWITLATVVPEAGYTQGLDPTLTSLDKFGMYLPDFDAIGMEMTPKTTVAASRYICHNSASGADNPAQGFGFVPRMSKFKIAQNLVNGDFNRHNLRDVYLPYTLDKQINVNDYQNMQTIWNAADNTDPEYATVALRKSITNTDLPVAGNIWREPTKYHWIGNFDRIFYKEYDDGGSKNPTVRENGDVGSLIGFGSYNNDNFLSHSIYGVNCYAPMKPIEDSYGLDDDDVGVTGVEYTSKA